MKRLISSLIIVSALWWKPVTADVLNLVIEPGYPPERSREVYQPLIEYLNRTTNHQINLITPKNYNAYWQSLKTDGASHLSLDEAHIAGYRIEKLGYDPLVKTFEDQSYTLIIGQTVVDESLKGLLGKSIATVSAPSLGYMMLIQAYKNPLQQPVFASTASSWMDTVEIVFDGSADAAMVPTWLAQRYPNLYPIYDSETFPGSAILASPDVSTETRDDIKQALLVLHEDDEAYTVLAELNISQFEEATSDMYRPHANMLRRIIGY